LQGAMLEPTDYIEMCNESGQDWP